MDVSKLAGKTFASEKERNAELVKLFEADKAEYERQRSGDNQFPIDEDKMRIFLRDCLESAGRIGFEYFLQDMWAAREIYRSNVKHVYDIGSRIEGYISHLLAMEVHVTLLDIRPLPQKIEGMDFIQTNAMDLSNIPDNSIEVLSSLHAVEHFGLGRYGDPIDYNGWKKTLHAIKRKLKAGGTFYFSVPISNEERVEFNNARIFNPLTIVKELMPELVLYEFSYTSTRKGRIFTAFKGGDDITILDEITKHYIGRQHAGLFIFKKPYVTLNPLPTPMH